VRLTISKENHSDETSIYFAGGNSEKSNEQRNAEKVQFNSAPYPNLYSLSEDKVLAINGLRELYEEEFVPLGFAAASAGEHTIGISHTDGMKNVEIFLHDLKNGIIHDLTQSNYAFEAEKGTNNQRFRLQIKPGAERARELVLTVQLFPNPTADEMNITLSKKQNAVFKITDATGKTHFSGNFSGKSFSVKTAELPSGFYILDIRSEEGNVSAKFVKE
jgi:hypothetical protein